MISIKPNNIAIIIPIYPNHYDYIYNLKKKINIIKKCCDIYLVFSNEFDYNNFKYKEEFEKIIIPQSYKTSSEKYKSNIVTYKKFNALNTLRNKYLYYIVCDAEIDIIDENFNEKNIMEKINEIYKNKKIFAGEVNKNNSLKNHFKKQIKRINEYSCNIFKNDDDINKLKKITNNYDLYYWWSDLPIYKGSHLDDFFSKINYEHLGWHHFDNIIYLNYLVLYHNFNFINISPIINRYMSLESYVDNKIENLEKLKKCSYTFSWIVPALFKHHKEYLIKNGSFILYHVDRE